MQGVRRPQSFEPVQVLVVGVGHLGKQHARIYSELEGVDLVGVVDTDAEKAREIGDHLGVPHFCEITPDLSGRIHAASVVTPTPAHFAVASQLVEAGISVLVEKPMTSSLDEARQLIDLAQKPEVTLQVGHIERFNPVILAAEPYIQNPVFLECDRIHPFSFRSAETSVVLDLMIHDIDNVLNIIKQPVEHLDAVGAQVLSQTEDLSYARITFANGCTAVVKSSRVAIQKSRKMRIFCTDAYLSLDFVAKTGMRLSLKEGFDRDAIDFQKMATLEEAQGAYPLFTQYFDIEQLNVANEEPLRAELEAFLLAVRTGRKPEVTGEQGYQAMDIAVRIQELIQKNQDLVKARWPIERGQ